MEISKNIDGKALAAEVRKKVAAEIQELKNAVPGFKPKLCIVQVSSS